MTQSHSTIRPRPLRPLALVAALVASLAFTAFPPAQASGPTTHAATGVAGGTVNNAPPAIDALKATPRTVVLGPGGDDEVRVTGLVVDDNGHGDIGSVTLKVTRPSGASAMLPATLTASPDDVTALSFSATYPVADGDEAGTYQVDGFATDLAGAQSPVRSATFRVASHQRTQTTPMGLPDGAADGQETVYRVTSPPGTGARLYVDVGSLACPDGAVPAVGNASILLGTRDADGRFAPTASLAYTESTLDLGALGEGTEFLVKLIPDDLLGAGACSASFGVYVA